MSYIGFKLSDEEKNQLEEAARKSGKNISTYLRDLSAADYTNTEQLAEIKSLINKLQKTIDNYKEILYFIRNYVFRCYGISIEQYADSYGIDNARKIKLEIDKRIRAIQGRQGNNQGK